MNMKFSMVLVLAALMCVSFASAQATWQLCDNAPTTLTVQTVTLNPDPPVANTNDTVTLTGTSTEALGAGSKVSLAIAYFGIPVFSKSYDICSVNACPQGPGAISASITVVASDLPATPPGDYTGTATILDQNNTAVTCVVVSWSLGF